MNDKAKQYTAIVLTTILAVAGALVALDAVPASVHKIAAIVLAVGGALGTALLPGVKLPGATVALLFVGAIGMAGCGPNAGATAKGVAIDTAACAVGQVPAAVASLLPEVTAAMQGSPAQWSTEIAALESQGVQVAICSIEAALHRLGLADLRAESPGLALARDRAQVYLAAHGVK